MPNRSTLASGMRVLCRDAEWLITKVDANNTRGDRLIHCIGTDDLVRGHESIFLEQLDNLEVIDPRKTDLVTDTTQGYRLAKLFLEAQLRQMPVTGIEPDLQGMGTFRSMRFQEDTVKHALSQLRPRLLLADAVGLGKSIQVGMILAELMRRGRADRILVLAKKSMLTQFQSELWNRFSIPLVRLDSEGIAKLRLRIPASKNPFEIYHRVIISMDTLKNVARYEHFLKDTRWDVVIIDEAHNVAGASVPERHLSNRLARLLARRSDSLILTTATPHNGKRETFGRLISLLDPAAIPDPTLKEYEADDIKGFFLMRFKEDVRDQAGDMLSERRVVPRQYTTLDASPKEESVYGILAELRELAKGTADDLPSSWSGRALVSYGLYKLFLSSPEACLATIEKRIMAISGKDTELPEQPLLEKLVAALSALSLKQSTRFQLLKKQLFDIGWDGTARSPRVVIFTEYRNTQDALAEAIAKDFKVKYSLKPEDQAKQVIASIHGSTPDVCLTKAVEAFATGSSPVRMLIATDVASEGINLHHECHNIIHFDLPWSIITLVQRNGRIDRLGQTSVPVIRYLMVNTKQGLLSGDDAIFDRLITKVEEINRLRQSGESVLELYDPEAEEEYVAKKGILGGDLNLLETPAAGTATEAASLEAIIKAAKIEVDDDFMKYLLGDDFTAAAPPTEEAKIVVTAKRVRLFADREYLQLGYRHLAERNEDYRPIQQHDNVFTLTAPKDLKRRLGAPDERGDVVFGSTAIPSEAWPENDEFRLTDDPHHADLAITAARNTSGYWSKDLLCTEQHPILKWITERLAMEIPRATAPFVLSPTLKKGELCFCFIGQVSSVAGSPLVSDAHTIFLGTGGRQREASLQESLEEIGFSSLVNTGATPDIQAARLLVSTAVEYSLQRMRRLQHTHEERMMPLLRKEERRLRHWKLRRQRLLEDKLDGLAETSPQARRWKKLLEEMEDYIQDREKNWRDTNFKASAEPITQLVLVIAGAGN